MTEFPCVEATRCLVTDTEMGMRLSVKTAPRRSENSHVTTFTADKTLKEEWYLQYDVVRSSKKTGGVLRRCVQLRHCRTNQYLRTDDKGRITCTGTSSESTWWFLQRIAADNSQASDQDGLSITSHSESGNTIDQYILVSRKYPLRRLCSTKAIEGSKEEFMLIASKNTATAPSIWTLTFTSGELCFIVNPVVHHHMRCNLYGSLSLTSQASAWEIFRFIEAGNGDIYISSWIHFDRFLSSNSDGKVYSVGTESKSPEQSERWRLEVPPRGNGLYIRNVATLRYLSVGRKRSEHLWTTTKPNDYALWHLDAPQTQSYYMTSLFASTSETFACNLDPMQLYYRDGTKDVHIASNKNGAFLSPKRESEEEWKVEVTPEGYFTFFSLSHEKYLGCNSKGDIHTTTSKGAWTLWTKKASSHGGVTFRSKEHDRYLAVSKTDNVLETTPGDEKPDLRHCWRIDPRIPRVVTGGSRGYFSGAMGMSVSETMPFAMLGSLEGARSIKLSNDTNIKRPISSWKSWVQFDQSPSPAPVIMHTSKPIPSSNGEKESNETTSASESQKTNDDKESVDTKSETPSEVNNEVTEATKNDDKSSDEPPELKDEGKEEKKSDGAPSVVDKKTSSNTRFDEVDGDII